MKGSNRFDDMINCLIYVAFKCHHTILMGYLAMGTTKIVFKLLKVCNSKIK